MSTGKKNQEPEVLSIARMEVLNADNDVKISFNLEQGFADYLDQCHLTLGLIPLMANENVEFVLDCLLKVFGPRIFENEQFKSKGKYVIGEYAINRDNNVLLNMNWSAIVEAMRPNEREEGALDMAYFVAFQKFSSVGSHISAVINKAMNSQKKEYLN